MNDLPKFLRRQPEYRRLTLVSDLLREASDLTGISTQRIRGAERGAEVVRVRWAIVWVLREYSGMTLTQIGRMIGDRDHSTICYAVNKSDAMRKSDKGFADLCNYLGSIAEDIVG